MFDEVYVYRKKVIFFFFLSLSIFNEFRQLNKNWTDLHIWTNNASV